MPDTHENLHDQIHDAEQEMKRIQDAAHDLQRAVDALVSDFAVKYPNADTSGLTEDFASRLADIVDDLEGPAYRRKSRLEDQIAEIEWKDLNRNSPIVI